MNEILRALIQGRTVNLQEEFLRVKCQIHHSDNIFSLCSIVGSNLGVEIGYSCDLYTFWADWYKKGGGGI